MLTTMMPLLPAEKPNHLLGIGDLESLEKSVQLGIDTFDSSHPTRCARHGLLFTKQGNVRILQSYYKNRFEPIDKTCECYTCTHYTAAYVHHLCKAKEMTGLILASYHNLHYMIKLMKDYQVAIYEDRI